jgi:hypothetical protein
VITDYINWFPPFYGSMAPLVFFACVYSLVWSMNDLRMFGNGFYLRRIIRSLIGIGCCATILLWPIPVFYWIIFNLIPNWSKSEIEQWHPNLKERSFE